MTEEKKPSLAKASEGKEELNIDDLKNQLEECQKQRDEYLAGWQRARADFLNYKKDEMERIGEFLKYAGEEFILRILPILDNFDLAEKKLPEDLKNDENIKGLLQIKVQILDFLKNQGVEEIKTIGEKFDPNLHEAVEMLDEDKSSSRPSSAKAGSEVEAKDKESGITGEEDKSSSSPTELSPRESEGEKECKALSDFAVARVIEEVQKGYKINGRLLRPARVKVVK